MPPHRIFEYLLCEDEGAGTAIDGDAAGDELMMEGRDKNSAPTGQNLHWDLLHQMLLWPGRGYGSVDDGRFERQLAESFVRSRNC